MNPRSFPNTRGALSDDEPEFVDMSQDSPASPEEAGANAISPSPTLNSPDYDPGEEADHVAPGSRSPSHLALLALFHQVRGVGASTPAAPNNLERGRRSREEEGRQLW